MSCGKTFSRVALFVMLLLFLLIWVSCVNPYKYLPNRPPETDKDSAALLARCTQAIPLDTTNSHFSPPVEQIPDSSAYYKAISDSLGKVRQTVRDSISIEYKDTCTSAVGLYEKGFNEGYDAGYVDGKKDGKTIESEIYKRQSRISDSMWGNEISKLKQSYNLRLTAAENQTGIANKNAEKYRGKSESRGRLNMWLIIALAVSLILNILQWKFKRQEKTANNIINDVRSVTK